MVAVSSARLFVYGSLKRGGRHHDLMARARFLGEAETAPGFGLETIGEYLAMVERPGAASSVPGELFELEEQAEQAEALLSVLDEFEGDDYARREVPVREMSGKIRFALAYLKKPR